MAVDKKIKELTSFANVTDANSLAKVALTFEDGDYSATLYQVAEYANARSKATQIISNVSIAFNTVTRTLTLSNSDALATINYMIAGESYSIASPASISASEVAGDIRFDMYYLDESGLAVNESETFITFASPRLIPLRSVIYIDNKSDIWESNGIFTTLINAETIRFSRSIQERGTTLDTDNNLTLSVLGNYATMNDNTNEIQLISNIDSGGKGWVHGSAYDLYILAGTTIKHDYPTTDFFFSRILIDAGQDWTANNDTLIHMRFDTVYDAWVVQGTATGDILIDTDNIIAAPINIKAYEMGSGVLSGWEIDGLLDCTVTNEGTADVSINTNKDSTSIGVGTIFGIDIKNSSGDTIHYFVCCENSVNEPYLFDIITGDIYYLSGEKIVIEQDSYTKIKDLGFTVKTVDSTGNLITVPYKLDGTQI